jgi:hypothetical protein
MLPSCTGRTPQTTRNRIPTKVILKPKSKRSSPTFGSRRRSPYSNHSNWIRNAVKAPKRSCVTAANATSDFLQNPLSTRTCLLRPCNMPGYSRWRSAKKSSLCEAANTYHCIRESHEPRSRECRKTGPRSSLPWTRSGRQEGKLVFTAHPWQIDDAASSRCDAH